MHIPVYLKPGDTIGITCPAGALSLETIQPMLDQLTAWGFQLKIGATVGTNFQKYSAPDEIRAADLQQMLDDPNVDAILFGRGGYGVVRIIDQIDFARFIQHPKWLLGYSDITCFHSHIHTQFQIATMHAHMSGGYLPNDKDEASTQSIYDCLLGKPIEYSVVGHAMNRVGTASGQLIGGNLALLSDLIGTPSDIDTAGKILMIEDIGEYKYNIDRMLWQLKRSGKLNHLAGLIVGGFTDTMDNEVPFGMTEYEIVWEKVKEFNYPVCFDFPVGHQARNLALKFGAQYLFQVSHETVQLKELPKAYG
ncbi:MAG TPA: LD-carboxypeptidase [Chitinophagaceae bacterium]|nr:LD-carboxypeptidase [Chitinophagaceae bacterium]